jgi:cation-transporting P-type ATPase C
MNILEYELKNKEIRIQHAIAGRIRFKIPVIRFNADACRLYEARFAGMNGIRWAGANPNSASLIVSYDPGRISRREVMERLFAVTQDKRKRAVPHAPVLRPRPENDFRRDSLKSALQRFIGLSVLVGGVFFRELFLKRIFAQSLFSPLGLVTALAALPLIRSGWKKLKEGRLSLESFLGGSVFAATLAGEAKAALEILWITSAGELLQNWVAERSRRAIRDILEVTEKETYILTGGVEVSTPVNQVGIGDTVVLHTGEKIAVDGEILRGTAVIDEAPITGRAEPAVKAPKDKVFAGTFVQQGVIYVRAEQVGDRTYLARILRMVEESLENKAPIESVADRLARSLIKAGLAATIGTLVITGSLWRAFSVMLVMACPCATMLAASTAVSAALSAAARRHILIKGGRYLEEIRRADVICFDKTGTLTTNQPQIRELVNLNGLPEDELLRLAYSTEIHNSHPLALAIQHEARRRGLAAIQHEVCEYILGKGVRSIINGEEVLVGSHKLMAQFGVEPDKVKQYLQLHKEQGLTQVFVTKNAELVGVIGFANQERPNLQPLMAQLKSRGIRKTVMITGDSKHTSLAMACRLNFDQCRYSVLPEEKAQIVAGLKAEGYRVLMVGDGINDALALAEADIGVAMGAGGTEVAIEAADIALVKNDLSGVVYVCDLSRKTMEVIHQNFWIATGTNIAGVVLGAMGWLSPVLAGLAHITHTLGILANSSRLLFFDPPQAGSDPTAELKSE